MLVLRTEDGDSIPVDQVFVAHCLVLNAMKNMEISATTGEADASASGEDLLLPLSAVQSPILLLVMQFSTELHLQRGCACFLKDDRIGKKTERTRQTVEEWIKAEARPPNGLHSHSQRWMEDFFSVLDQQSLVDFINLANMLDFPEAVELGCKQIALIIRGKSPEEIRKLFNIESDFTDAELVDMRGQYQWASAMLNKPF